ncbi:4'-phosphopantetheinyl transferase family protein [Leptolyngbya sp. AN02str]
MKTPSWLIPPIRLELPAESIHIWRVDLGVGSATLQRFARMLSLDECQRAEQFRFERDRNRFIVGRGALRCLLGQYLEIEPSQLQFRYGATGKPELWVADGEATLHFNVSHSQDLMLCAIAQHQPVGIDVEYCRSIPNLSQLTQHFFAHQEHVAIQALPPDLQPMLFFQYWTCKEALLKATGIGIQDLKKIEVMIADGIVQQMQWNLEAQHQPQFGIELFCPASEYMAAIAIHHHEPFPPTSSQSQHGLMSVPCKFWQWPE